MHNANIKKMIVNQANIKKKSCYISFVTLITVVKKKKGKKIKIISDELNFGSMK